MDSPTQNGCPDELTEKDMRRRIVRMSAQMESVTRRVDRVWEWMRVFIVTVFGFMGTIVAGGITLLLALT